MVIIIFSTDFLQNEIAYLILVEFKTTDMKVIDLYNLQEGKVEKLVATLKRKPKRAQEVVEDAMRLIYNLNSLLTAFPQSGRDQKFEIKRVILKLQKLVKELQVDENDAKEYSYGKFRLAHS